MNIYIIYDILIEYSYDMIYNSYTYLYTTVYMYLCTNMYIFPRTVLLGSNPWIGVCLHLQALFRGAGTK